MSFLLYSRSSRPYLNLIALLSTLNDGFLGLELKEGTSRDDAIALLD
jgi:hypothetical protein